MQHRRSRRSTPTIRRATSGSVCQVAHIVLLREPGKVRAGFPAARRATHSPSTSPSSSVPCRGSAGCSIGCRPHVSIARPPASGPSGRRGSWRRKGDIHGTFTFILTFPSRFLVWPDAPHSVRRPGSASNPVSAPAAVRGRRSRNKCECPLFFARGRRSRNKCECPLFFAPPFLCPSRQTTSELGD